ncbi:polyprotein [Bienertia sinuspersici]
MGDGIYLVRFSSKENKDLPLVVKQWTLDFDYADEDIMVVPIWVKLLNMDILYWGERIGKGLRVDRASTSRDRLIYARVSIEVRIRQKLPETISFVNEVGKVMSQRVIYEWRHILCIKCEGFGHGVEEC